MNQVESGIMLVINFLQLISIRTVAYEMHHGFIAPVDGAAFSSMYV